MADESDNRARRETRLLLELGRGGMGVVYLALSQGPAGWSKLKVVKRLRPDFAQEPRAVQMFLEEARLAARLRHPNIVQTNEVGFDGKHYFLEMEYLEGKSYEALLRRAAQGGGALDLPLSIAILAQTLAGLEHAHTLVDLDGTELHVVHRDVSPHNVFVTYEGEVKLLDFGIAKAADRAGETSTGVVKGKVTYMAPEQASRRPVDHRADVFAVGVMLWQALTRQRLWGEASEIEIFLKLQEADVPAPSTVAPGVDPKLEAVAVRALAKDREARWPTARAMREALEAWLDENGHPIGPRQLAKAMADLFAADREEERREIESQMRRELAFARTVEVPRLGGGERELGPHTGSAGMSSASTIGPDARRRDPTRAEGPRGRGTRRRRWMIPAIALAIVASAAAVVVRTTTSRAPVVAAAPSAPVVARECAHAKECLDKHGGAPWICRDDGACASLVSDECSVFASDDDIANDATVWFGVMFPLSGARAGRGAQALRAVDLGRRDFMEIAHGIPSIDGARPPRPIGLVACDDVRDADKVAHHLVDDVRVPAVIGFGSSQDVIDLAQSVFAPARTLAIASANISALITGIPDVKGEPRLVFRTSLSGAISLVPVSFFVPQVIEPRVRAERRMSADEPIRLAVVRPGTTLGLSLGDTFFALARFNGKSALENGPAYHQIVYGALPENGQPADEVVDALRRFRPHVVVYVGGDEVVPAIIAPFEQRIATGDARPYWIAANSILRSDRALFAFIGKNAERRHRFYGVQPPSTVTPNAKFTMRYNETYADEITLNESPGGSYDALYVLAYAAFANGDAPLTGPSLSRAIARLVPPGKPVDVGPTRIFDGFAALRDGGNADLVGANSNLDFDLATGEPSSDLVIQCVGVDEHGGAFDGVESGLIYRATTKTLDGALKCP